MVKWLLELTHYVELIKALIVRDLKARYKGSVLGYVWTWLDPLLTMLVFIIVFDIILAIEVKDYPIYLLAGLIPWNFFGSSVTQSVNSITGNRGLIKKIYYPREIFPLTVVLANGVNMGLSFIVLTAIIFLFSINVGVGTFLVIFFNNLVFFTVLALLAVVLGNSIDMGFNLIVLVSVIILYKLQFSPVLLLLIVATVCLFLISFGVSLIVSFMNVFFRDITYVVPFVIRLWFFLTPVFWSLENGKIPKNFIGAYLMANPLAVILAMYRSAFLGNPAPAVKYVLCAFTISSLVFCTGYVLFKRYEDEIARRV